MNWIPYVILFIVLGLLFWELRVCEGVHLGREFVVWLYDLTASRYDRIKGFDFEWEQRFLGEPIITAIAALPDARVLDVGAGTGRLSRTLFPHWSVDGLLVNLEPSKAMLALGRQMAVSDRMPWVRAYAVPLPFEDDSFDIVTSFEVLEFTPDPRETLAELVRVLHPGGWLLITNRVGWEAPWILGRFVPRKSFSSALEEFGVRDVTVYPWQMDYDLAWARKPYIAEK